MTTRTKRRDASRQHCRHFGRHDQIDFARIADLARNRADSLIPSWLLNGERRGHEWVALNPRRTDRNLGSFSINLCTGRWADFATGDRGGDLISLRAYLDGVSQKQAALTLQRELTGGSPCR